MASTSTKAERIRRAREVLESTARRSALRTMAQERDTLVSELVGIRSEQDLAVPSGSQRPTSLLCADLATALDRRRASFVERSVGRATPGRGQEAIAFLDLDEAIRLEQLRIHIGRLERAIEAVGCPIR